MFSKEQCDLLKARGFQWYKDQCTDRVDAECIAEVHPAAKGFTVVYKEGGALVCSTAEVEQLELPSDLDKEWIRVHWDTIADERRS